MKLFEVIPERFFQLLTGPNKHLYAEAVLLVYEQSLREGFGIRYDILRDLLQELIETRHELGMAYSLEGEEEGEPAVTAAVSAPGQVTLEEVSRAQANFLIRRLELLQWINVEVRDQFQRYVVLPHYSSRMMALFQELCEARAVEYQRFAFITYQLLTGEEAKRRPCFAIREALQATVQFRQELITLYNNMKHHMEQVVQKTSIQDVLDHHFDVYKSQIVDKSYHRLKTSDHVSRYRFQILQTVQVWLLDRELFAETVEDGLKSDVYRSREEAEAHVRETLLTIEEIYAGLDDIFYQIDVRHNQYLRSSYDRARYLSQHQQGISQQLADLLERMAEKILDKHEDATIYAEWFRFHHNRQLSENSLLPPRHRRQPHQPETHEVVNVSEELKEQLRAANLERMRRAITRKKVERYVLDKLDGRAEMELKELAPQSLEQFLLLTYVYLYGQNGSSPFQLKRNEERIILHIGPYRFHNHLLVHGRGK